MPSASEVQAPSETAQELFYLSLNSSSQTTVVLLHGLLSCNLEYAEVIPYLSAYHLLVVDLPAHSGSISVKPFSLSIAADLVAKLIRKHAHSGRAHVVGLSMGGFTALEVAKLQPDVVESLWVTGAAPFQGWFTWFAERPKLVYGFMNLLTNWLPRWLYNYAASWRGLHIPTGLIEEQKKNLDSKTVRQVYASILTMTLEEVQKISVRTLSVAGGIQDDVDATRKMGLVLKMKNEKSKAVLVKKAVHAWDLQHPQLFADGIKAWIEEKQLPAEYEDL
ncbi:hypothetical protein LTR84_009788 [Exophiala bonariae]|uniref:AB hydrolase-1 domain-containing protein n=1 Tax=Exophiala bonariae TaxID=1690606 RepID=A0AAV9NLU5_9EURO|nr:hypothetical protein LTR84_009788 [Exophiala bonariae]